MEARVGEWGLAPVVSVELDEVAVELFGKSPDYILRLSKCIVFSLSWTFFFGSRLFWSSLSSSVWSTARSSVRLVVASSSVA